MKKETIPMPRPNDWITRIKTNAIDQQSPRKFADGTWFVFGCHQIQIEQLIGKGVFGEVYSVKTNASQKLCLKVQEYNHITVDQINLEMTVMYQIKQSPGASKWLMTDVLAFSLTGLHCFAMEEMGFSLLNLLNQKTGPFDLEMIRGISTGMLMGLAHLHYLGYTHSDIKPSNILLNRTSTGSTFAKIADLGNVNITREMSKLRYKNCVQATWYRPPEVYLGMQQDNKTDIWAAGCVLAEMYTGRALFPTPEQLHQLSRMHFWLTGLPTNAETEGRFFFSYYNVDEMTGIRRPLTDIELMGYQMRLESYQERPYTQMEQLLSLGRNARARGLTVEDYFILDLLKNMLQADGNLLAHQMRISGGGGGIVGGLLNGVEGVLPLVTELNKVVADLVNAIEAVGKILSGSENLPDGLKVALENLLALLVDALSIVLQILSTLLSSVLGVVPPVTIPNLPTGLPTAVPTASASAGAGLGLNLGARL